jgi:hypothetical protein
MPTRSSNGAGTPGPKTSATPQPPTASRTRSLCCATLKVRCGGSRTTSSHGTPQTQIPVSDCAPASAPPSSALGTASPTPTLNSWADTCRLPQPAACPKSPYTASATRQQTRRTRMARRTSPRRRSAEPLGQADPPGHGDRAPSQNRARPTGLALGWRTTSSTCATRPQPHAMPGPHRPVGLPPKPASAPILAARSVAVTAHEAFIVSYQATPGTERN